MTNRDRKINEATVSSSSGKYSNVPLVSGERLFNKQQMQPFYIPTSKYDNAELAYDSYDGKMSTPKKDISKKEKMARKVSTYIKNHPIQSDGDGNVLSGSLNVKEGWVEITQNTDVDLLTEDLAVWFGTKKKPKGSKQPKGPWVNICRKKEGGGHPPCGRPEASSKGYPKCRAAGVASKMTDSQKKSACQQKRSAEKSEPKSGTGNKPTMVSYKPKKKQNEDMKKILRLTESDLVRLVKKIINEQTQGTEMSFDKFKNKIEKENFRGELGALPFSRITGINTVKIYTMISNTQDGATRTATNLAKMDWDKMKDKKPNIQFKSYEYVRKLDDNRYEALVAVKVS